MRDEDLKRFAMPYDGGADFPNALGVRVANTRQLANEILADLDPKHFGVGWWRVDNEPKLALQQRILISDYLIDALHGVESNLIDLQLHFLELQHAWAREADFVKGATTIGSDGRPIVKLPPRLSPMDDLVHSLVDLHTSGVFRAIGSALDCLASAVVGVGAIESNILRADWSALIDRTLPALQDDGTPGRRLQVGLRDDLMRLLGAGNKEWDRWSSDYRNMQVHRGPRMKMSTLRPDNSSVDERGARVIQTHTIHQLTRDPELSEIESFVVGAKLAPVLTEDAHITVNGVIHDLTTLVERVAAALDSVWRERRAAPTVLMQPVAKQWPKVRTNAFRSFAGYSPGETPYRPSSLSVNPTLSRRLQAASIGADDAKKTWT